MSESKFKFPSEVVELPSKGLVYPKDNPLSSGKIEMKYMTAREEDILTNQSYIQNGTVLDKLLQSLIVTKVDYNDLITGDKNALLIAARILGYGKIYEFMWKGEKVSVDLTTLDNREIDPKSFTTGKNEYNFVLPNSGATIQYKLLTHNDEKKIDAEVKGLKKINKNASPELSTRLKYMLLSVNGETEQKDIRDFVDNYFLATDSRAFRNHIKEFQPDINLRTTVETGDGGEEDVDIPINLNFFWPDAAL